MEKNECECIPGLTPDSVVFGGRVWCCGLGSAGKKQKRKKICVSYLRLGVRGVFVHTPFMKKTFNYTMENKIEECIIRRYTMRIMTEMTMMLYERML